MAVFQGISSNAPNQISSSARKRRLPHAIHGIDINFCRNPQCGLFMVPPGPYDKRGKSGSKVKSNFPRGSVIGSGSEKTFKCGACGQSPILKKNRAIVQEYRRLRTRFLDALPKDACPSDGCETQGKAVAAHPGLYRKSGKAAKGVQRWKCKACLCTYSVGSSIKRQKRSHVSRDILWMLTNGTKDIRA